MRAIRTETISASIVKAARFRPGPSGGCLASDTLFIREFRTALSLRKQTQRQWKRTVGTSSRIPLPKTGTAKAFSIESCCIVFSLKSSVPQTGRREVQFPGDKFTLGRRFLDIPGQAPWVPFVSAPRGLARLPTFSHPSKHSPFRQSPLASRFGGVAQDRA